MKNSKFLTKRIFCLIIALFMCAIPFMPKFSNNNISFAASVIPEENQRTLGARSTFIHSPTYSVIYHEKVYFFDEYDNKIKKYTINSGLEEDTLSIQDLGVVIDIDYLGEYIFVLSKTLIEQSETLKLTLIDLSNFTVEKTLAIENVDLKYKDISICEVDDNFLVSLTPDINETSILPVILTLNKTSLEISNKCLIQIDEVNLSSLFKFTIVESAGTNENDIYLVLTFDKTIYFFGTIIEKIIEEENINIDLTKSSLSQSLETTSQNIKLVDINKIIVNNELMFLITYNTTEDNGQTIVSTYSKLYSYAIDVTDENKKFESKLSIVTNGYQYITTANSCLLYPLKNEQQIVYTEISYSTENQVYFDTTPFPYIKNPTIAYEYYDEDNFKYAVTNTSTKLLTTTPWALNNENNVELDEVKDIIIIGKGKISGENSIINGFEYCMITTEDKNIKGFVKSENLTLKDEISVDNYDYRVFRVQPNTNLYSLPTTIEEFGITDTLNSRIISTIKDNSKVELIDAICKYKSNEKIMLKVKVNNEEIGYIEYDRIIKPSNLNNFVITNASIKSNNTNIYLNSSDSSPIIYTLNKGYRIRINGPRNTETGYTSVTFNDEYGNEFTGYILTDAIGSDSWTTMQIIGCVLIAINVGLLILILRFKKKNIGNDGSKYIENENK